MVTTNKGIFVPLLIMPNKIKGCSLFITMFFFLELKEPFLNCQLRCHQNIYEVRIFTQVCITSQLHTVKHICHLVIFSTAKVSVWNSSLLFNSLNTKSFGVTGKLKKSANMKHWSQYKSLGLPCLHLSNSRSNCFYYIMLSAL